ncbi:MAG TPA: DEAD/DEAH box helicase [Candidatus Methylacidiphilales bacterium]|jgi:ATP-dependent RNA helicase RhlE|nr:DEAD/DEAH box helicase [Candidatus Methylacidiphilales bacterium]
MTHHTTLTPSAPAATPPPAPTTAFTDLSLAEPLLRALNEKNYTVPSPIQAKAIPFLLQGRDLIGIAQTGTGKTAAFALPILQRLAANPAPATPKRPRALILAPTRELAAQIAQSFAAYGKFLKLSHAAVFGGVSLSPQIRALQRGVDILIATPGRLQDLERSKHVVLDKVEVFVLDEADRMLDLGFVHEIKRIITKLPPKRQSLLFSATMPPAIQDLASSIVHNPARVEVTPAASTVERIEQHVCFVNRHDKARLLVHFINTHPQGLVLVFVRMKHMANKLVDQLFKDSIKAEAIHGNKSQPARQRALENFRAGRSRVLVATDIAARGIDVKGIALVVNFDLPEEPESYVHRIGRTARAGLDGIAVAFCDTTERNLLRNIERLIRRPVPVLKGHPFEGAAGSSNGPRETGPNFGSGIDRPHRPAPRHGGFRSHSNNRTAPRTGGVGFTRAGFARSGGSRY